MKDIIEGFLKFHSDAYPKRADLFKNLATKQNPRTLFISCLDNALSTRARYSTRTPGGLFVIRNAGNIVPSYGPEAWRCIGVS